MSALFLIISYKNQNKGIKINGNFLYPPGIHPKRTHESFVTAGNDILAGKNIDTIGTKQTSQGVFGPIKLTEFIKIPNGVLLENMHAIWLGLMKNFNFLFFHSQNKDEPYYIGNYFKIMFYINEQC
jgi:hypothetical protein